MGRYLGSLPYHHSIETTLLKLKRIRAVLGWVMVVICIYLRSLQADKW